MDQHDVSRSIEALEHDLAHDDPAFLKRCRALQRADSATFVSVFLLLAAGAVLLTVGLATFSWLATSAGALAFLASFAVDEHHERALHRAS